jgi:pyruvate dehydrogenase phosphatase
LKKLFPGEDDIVVCKKDNRSCYVKGRLQPTRSLGDLRLKHKEFNNPDNYAHDHDYQKPLEKFTGPYITWEPEIQVFNLKPTHKCLILASDGLWDELQRQEVAELFRNSPLTKMPELLITRTL